MTSKPLVSVNQSQRKRSKQYYAVYREENREKLLEYKRQWRLENQAKDNETSKKRYWSNHEEERAKRTKWEHRKRLEILDLLGSRCFACGFKDWRALQVDHINGKGTQDRKTQGHSPSVLLRKIKESILADEGKYQLLCANCNWIKRYERRELCKSLS